jgi:hypothetical protein
MKCVYREVRTESLHAIQVYVSLCLVRALTEVSRRPLTEEVRFRCQAGPCEMYGGHSTWVSCRQ